MNKIRRIFCKNLVIGFLLLSSGAVLADTCYDPYYGYYYCNNDPLFGFIIPFGEDGGWHHHRGGGGGGGWHGGNGWHGGGGSGHHGGGHQH
jgi:hypothetical protein